MKNAGLKQANALVNSLEANDEKIDDVSIVVALKNGTTFKIMSDGSIVKISDDTKDNTVFENANEALASLKVSKKQTDSIKTYIIKVRR